MNFFKIFGDKLKKAIKYLKSEAGDLMIYAGLFLLPITTYQISVIAASYVLSAVLIIIGINVIRAKGGEK